MSYTINQNKQKVMQILKLSLGQPTKYADQTSFYCPFCSHHKKKLSVNIQKQKWRCWVCNKQGHSFVNLLKRLQAPQKSIQIIGKIYETTKMSEQMYMSTVVQLPKQFIPLYKCKKTSEIIGVAKNYLEKRNITQQQLSLYNIGVCLTGQYKNRIIIPSYDENGFLNYFVGRSFLNTSMRYKNPPCQKETIIVFENMIDWNLPITICQGVFDALAVKYNAVPLLGKYISAKLITKLKQNKCKVKILLDPDAKTDSYQIAQTLRKHGIKDVVIVQLDGKDPSDCGHYQVWKKINETKNVLNDFDLFKNNFISKLQGC